jgi:outer membrane immunogenic protein
MKKLLLATAALVALGAIPAAADGMRARAPAALGSGCANFGGFYVGGHGGWVYYHNDWKDQDNYGFNQTGSDHIGDGTLTDSSWHAGVHGGYNWQQNCTVFGIQADWSWTDAGGGSFYTDFPLASAGRASASSNLDWFSTIRTRTGLVVNNVLLYATGGVAFAHFERDFVYTRGATTETFSSDNSRVGFVAGVGTDWAISSNLILNSEFLYLGFDKDEQTYNCTRVATCPGGVVGTPFRYEFQDSAWVSRIGLTYRFGADRRVEPLK